MLLATVPEVQQNRSGEKKNLSAAGDPSAKLL
jgi:hypothetical protein